MRVMMIFGALIGIFLLPVAIPVASAAAAECTDVWTGPAEGTWVTAANWSAGHVPNEVDVACIGSGKTVKVSSGTNKVSVVQGEGTLKIIEAGSLELRSVTEASTIKALSFGTSGTLTGPGTLNISGSLAFGGGNMTGSGSTILQSGGVGTIGGSATIKERTLVNHGALTFSTGFINMQAGSRIENAGTFTANSASAGGLTQEGETSLFINTGTFQKTSGAGETRLSADIENKGTIVATTGKFVFSPKGPGSTLATGSTIEGTIQISSGTVKGQSFSDPSGTMTVSGGTLSMESGSTATVANLAAGNISGAGTVDVSNSLTLSGGISNGTGSTVLLSGGTGTIGEGISIRERTVRNEGTMTYTTGFIAMKEGATLRNSGTFNANSSNISGITREGTGATPKIINTGTFRKVAETGRTEIKVFLENEGLVQVSIGKLNLKEGGSGTNGTWSAGEGASLNLSGSSWIFNGGALEGTISLTALSTIAEGLVDTNAALSLTGSAPGIGSVMTVPKGTMNLSKLTLGDGGHVTGGGTLEIEQSLLWVGGVMEGSGATVLLPAASAALEGAEGTSTAGHTLNARTFVNRGTVTWTSSYISMKNGARLENRGVFNANNESANFSEEKTGAPPLIVNTGTFQKSAGGGGTSVRVNFENFGAIRELTGKLTIAQPVTARGSTATPNHSCEGDPVDCATGNFTETQTDFELGALGVDLDLVRTYSAQDAKAETLGIFGYGWTNSFGDKLTAEESGAKQTLTEASGGTITFTQSGATYLAPPWSLDTLSGSTEEGFTLTLPDQTKEDFSGLGRLESITDRAGNEMTLGYNASSALETITDPTGRSITLTYNAEGLVETAKDPMGHEVKYGYEGKMLRSVTMPGEASPKWQFKYDASRRMTSMTNGRGGLTTNEYDSSSRVIAQIDPAERKTTWEYAPFHTKITNKSTGTVIDEWFNSYNQPVSITRGFGTAAASTETFSYTGGLLAGFTDATGHSWSYGYDLNGNRTSEKDPLGHETKWAYDAAHDLISTTTARGETTTITRDANGNIESISRPAPGELSQSTTFVYDEHGQLETLTDPLGHSWSYSYDSYGDRTSETDPLGHTQTTSYDEDSRLVSVVPPRGNLEGANPSEYETTVDRDPQGRPLKIIDPLGAATEYAYDANGNLVSMTDAKEHTTKYTYNPDDECTKVEKPSGATLETGYDGAGYVTSQTDGNGKTTTYVRNVLEQPVEVIDPLGRKTVQSFDAAGNLATVTDPTERQTTYSYDTAGRLAEIDYSEEATADASFEYDQDGNVVAISDGTGKSSFEYDQLGRLTRSEDGNGETVEYGYNLGEQQTGIIYPNGKSISRGYDAAGRLESITDWLGGTTSFGYDADSNLTGIAFPAESGNVDEYGYDHASRLSSTTFKKASESVASLSYVRDALGQIEKESRVGLPGAEEISYGYDQNNRLVEAGPATFEYDAANNLTKGIGSTNTYDAASQLEAGTGVTYAYDSRGDRIKATPSTGPATSYGYDQAGHLVSISRPEEGEVSAISESFAYNVSGLIASKTSGVETQQLSWDMSAQLPLLLADGKDSYLYGPNGLPIEQITTAEAPTYLHHDQLGSTRMLTNSSGEAIEAASYTPYGDLEAKTGTGSTPVGFAGQYTDTVSGLQYLRARFYDPGTAQFITKDPQAQRTREPYGYAGSNPLRYVDPAGLGPCLLGFIACDESDDPCDSVLTGPMLPACLIPEEDSEEVVNASAGLGDEILSPLPGVNFGEAGRDLLGIHNVNTCSKAYSVGKGVGMFVSAVRDLASGSDIAGRALPDVIEGARAGSRKLDEKFVHVPLP